MRTRRNYTQFEQIEIVNRINRRIENGMSVLKSIDFAGIHFTTYYNWRNEYQLFPNHKRYPNFQYELLERESDALITVKRFLSSAPAKSALVIKL